MGGSILGLALGSALNRRLTAFLTIIAVALSLSLFLGVEKIRESARDGFDRTISGTDLIVGARSGPINLVLYSVFHIGDATANMSWESYEEIANHPAVAWAIPISLGDSHQGYRVMGTTQAFFEHYRYGRDEPLRIAEGDQFSDTLHVVIGANVAQALDYALGDEIILAHGAGAVSFHEHDNLQFEIVGILERTGTPIDNVVLTSLEAIEAIHVGWINGAPSAMSRMVTEESLDQADLSPDEITAAFIGLSQRTALLRLQRDINTYRAEPLTAVIPGLALQQLWSVVSIVERALTGISAFVIFVGLLTILTSILTSLNERRREMAVLRALGARPWHVFALLISESAILALLGGIAGVAFLYGGIGLVAPWLETVLGLQIAIGAPGLLELIAVIAVTAASGLLGVIPAWRAYRNSLADGLTIRL